MVVGTARLPCDRLPTVPRKEMRLSCQVFLSDLPMSWSTFFGVGRYEASSADRNTSVGINTMAQKPVKIAKRSMTGIGATAIRNRQTQSVMMPRMPGAIITPSEIWAAFFLSFTS